MQDRSKPPPGWSTWGHFGDGLWRAGRNTPGRNDTQDNNIAPQATEELAIEAAWAVCDKRTLRV